MVRRLASQVHKTASRLIREQYIKKEPAWFQAVLENPPLPLPAKAPPARTRYDIIPEKSTTSSKHTISLTVSPTPIRYIEDQLRRQFFLDHPLEAFRATTLVEKGAIEDAHPIRGKLWARLRQRGRNPKPEDAILYAVNLYEHHDFNLGTAYEAAISQFRALRSERFIATAVAKLEASAYGIHFGPNQVDINVMKENKMLKSWKSTAAFDAGEEAARKRWRAIVQKEEPGAWTRGQSYVRLWREGIRPTYYAPLVTPQFITSAGLSSKPESAGQQPAAHQETART